MAKTNRFSELRDRARRDPVRARRIDDGKHRALEEPASYRLAELRKALLSQLNRWAVTSLDLGATLRALRLIRTPVAQGPNRGCELVGIFGDVNI